MSNDDFGIDIDSLQENFKSLAKELLSGAISIDAMLDRNTPKKQPYFRNYNPNILDFLARAKTEQECIEIIDYCLSRNEITKKDADVYKQLLSEGGPEIFGTREPGYYDRML